MKHITNFLLVALAALSLASCASTGSHNQLPDLTDVGVWAALEVAERQGQGRLADDLATFTALVKDEGSIPEVIETHQGTPQHRKALLALSILAKRVAVERAGTSWAPTVFRGIEIYRSLNTSGSK